MKMTYRTRRRLHRLGFVSLVVLVSALGAWFCRVIWLQRYVVYSQEGAKVDFELGDAGFAGVVATTPQAQGGVSIFYNEGSDAIEISKELSPINGYYVDYNSLLKEMDTVEENLDLIPSGTPVLVELKGGYGSFYYTTKISGATLSTSIQNSISTARVDRFIQKLKDKGCYMIAKISAFQDWEYGNSNVTNGLYMTSRAGLWMDDQGCFWLDPTSAGVQSWITSAVLELKNMGFHEVMLSNFRFPVSDAYIYTGDKTEALQNAMQNLLKSTASDGGTFTLSFGTNDPTLSLIDGARSRIYFEDIDAANVETVVSQSPVADKAAQIVFLAKTNDTRFDSYSVLRPLTAAKTLEAQKADQAGTN